MKTKGFHLDKLISDHDKGRNIALFFKLIHNIIHMIGRPAFSLQP
jgi:hypothetical protein